MRTEVILGQAGTGKSTLLRKRIEDDPMYARLTATTGIAAVNLGTGVSTVHSTLGFFNTRNARQRQDEDARITKGFINLARQRYKNLVIDELSMLSGELLDVIYEGACDAYKILESGEVRITETIDGEKRERFSTADDAVGILLSGDFLQLPPISTKEEPAQFAFQAKCWPEFSANITELRTIYRQQNPVFQEALTFARQGRGVEAAIALKKSGVSFTQSVNYQDDGAVCLYPVNQQVDNHNQLALDLLPGKVVSIPSQRWGREASEWKNIPASLELKDGALVMILINNPPLFDYVNGDLAQVSITFPAKATTAIAPDIDADQALYDELSTHDINPEIKVVSHRGYSGIIPYTIRRNLSFRSEDSMKSAYDASAVGKDIESEKRNSKRWIAKYLDYVSTKTMRGIPWYDPQERGTVIGEVRYMPLRLAYASSTHKAQGLTFDNVNICINHMWAGNPQMMYVALSRARSAEGITIIGDLQTLSRKIKTHPLVTPWV